MVKKSSLISPINDWSKNCVDQAHGENYSIYQGDCVPCIMGMPDNSVVFRCFLPRFRLSTFTAIQFPIWGTFQMIERSLSNMIF